jgi:hypothetical protein
MRLISWTVLMVSALLGCASPHIFHVTDIAGDPLPGAGVTSVSLSMAAGPNFTDAMGNAALPSNVQGGRWIEVSKSGFQPVCLDVPATWPIRITLRPLPASTQSVSLPKPYGAERFFFALSIVQLPRPNSGAFTQEQAAARKSEIYTLSQTGLITDWKNPFLGFSVHITPADQIVIYNSFLGEGPMTYVELIELLNKYHAMQRGNSLGVLVTCECDPKQSFIFPQVVELLFKPSIQIFYSKIPKGPLQRTGYPSFLADGMGS